MDLGTYLTRISQMKYRTHLVFCPVNAYHPNEVHQKMEEQIRPYGAYIFMGVIRGHYVYKVNLREDYCVQGV